MKIVLHEVAVRDLTKGFSDNGEDGVIGFDGRLDIRPAYQREFVYKQAQQIAVINTVIKNFPLNVMYWVQTNPDEKNETEIRYEVLDGQQRTLSICSFVNNDFHIKQDGNEKYFKNLTKEEQEAILDYRLMIYFCIGSDKEKLDWFRTINIAGEKLTEQELRNAVYTGQWLSDAKSFLSKSNGAGVKILEPYLKGSPNRQEVLETALDWISDGKIEAYMSVNQKENDASELRKYVKNLVAWIEETFTEYRREMKSVDWGLLYKKFKNEKLDKKKLEEEIDKLMRDEEVEKKSGIYPYVLTKDERHLTLRAFLERDKTTMFSRQKGICLICENKFKIDEMEADHIVPWSKGGKTTLDNCQMLCQKCNREKSDK